VQAVWTSFEAIHDALLNIVSHVNIDNKTVGKARATINQLVSFDFILSVMMNIQPFQLLQPPITIPTQESVMQLVDMFPENRPDCHALQAEVDIFVGAHHEMITDGVL